MGVEDIITAGKVASKLDDAARLTKVAEKAVYTYKGVDYAFPPGTSKDDAMRFLWKAIVTPRAKNKEVEITLPSELPKERIEELEKPVHTAEILPFVRPQEPKRLEPGLYVDEDTGKYFKIDKDGNMEPVNETP